MALESLLGFSQEVSKLALTNIHHQRIFSKSFRFYQGEDTSNSQESNQGRRLNSTAADQAKSNLTKMIITVNTMFVVSNFTLCIVYFCMMIFGPRSIPTHVTMIVSNLLLYLAHCSTLFVYLSFDKQFRGIIIDGTSWIRAREVS